MVEVEQRTQGMAWKVVALVVLVAAAVFVGGGYAAGWAWAGLSRRVTLWDWLEALALPVTVGLVPLFVQHRRRLHRSHKMTVSALVAGFGILVLAGYLVPLRWTGFTGNTLWDWLKLALLPVVIATAALWRRPERLSPRHHAMLAAGVAVAVLVVVAGYVVPWPWTGVEDNTAWDWIQLLLLPVLLPTLVLPRLVRAADRWMADQQQAQTEHADR